MYWIEAEQSEETCVIPMKKNCLSIDYFFLSLFWCFCFFHDLADASIWTIRFSAEFAFRQVKFSVILKLSAYISDIHIAVIDYHRALIAVWTHDICARIVNKKWRIHEEIIQCTYNLTTKRNLIRMFNTDDTLDLKSPIYDYFKLSAIVHNLPIKLAIRQGKVIRMD